MKLTMVQIIATISLTNAQVPVENDPYGTPNLVNNGDFSDGLNGWSVVPSGTVKDGMLCVTVPANIAPNASYIRTRQNFTEVKNDVYYLNFTTYASQGLRLWLQTQGEDPAAGGAPVDPNLNITTGPLSATAQNLTFPYSPANVGDNAYLAVYLGGSDVAINVCVGDISLRRINRLPYVQDTGPTLKVGQLGFLPDGPKVATLITQQTSAVNWYLQDASNSTVASGQSTPKGTDIASRENVHTVDFTSFTKEGTGYTLVTGDGATSYSFSVSPALYDSLRKDSMRFFYQQRSGIAIDGSLVGPEYARVAGHLQVAPNQGDLAVPCQYEWESNVTYGESWTCGYTLDVSKGWYDAGDQGKYVVNGGISTTQLLMAYERSLYIPNVSSSLVGDGSLLIPENNNGHPDFLDEARWEMEFMLKMQVPAGSAPQLVNGQNIDVSGLVHHKMHDNQWTQLPTLPSTDPKRRELHRPSTAATLNMAGTAAMSARLWAQYDTVFSQQCLAAARSAYAAAKANPSIHAPDSDGDLGGGAYSDNDATDEFYFAAVQLYITTGESQYEQDVTSSKYFTAEASVHFPVNGFSWNTLAGLGHISLATVPNNITNHQAIVDTILAGAEQYMQIQQNQPTGVMLMSYSWGSNSNHLNCLQVVATAYDLTGNTTYRSSALEALDYILGRNALAQSYVHGYGTKFSSNMHSRLYARELAQLTNRGLQVPSPPVGYMAGGANQQPSDPPADDVLVACAPQRCYVDDVNSYSTNEEAINWNSALAWAAAWAASQ